MSRLVALLAFAAAFLLSPAPVRAQAPGSPPLTVKDALEEYRSHTYALQLAVGTMHGVAVVGANGVRYGSDFKSAFPPGSPAARAAAEAEGRLDLGNWLIVGGLVVELGAITVGLLLPLPVGAIVMAAGLGLAVVTLLGAVPLVLSGRDLLERAVQQHDLAVFEELVRRATPPPPAPSPAS